MNDLIMARLESQLAGLVERCDRSEKLISQATERIKMLEEQVTYLRELSIVSMQKQQ
jgi:hypothetical protein